ncbi:uncharacterized protein CDAR_469631 [Caerostris darwini]|uniref:Uncharacterized protein n=1 Tax=Caerostris darwini TaxID=1538125 RepID=A0AAV4RLF5_9ARAC|nr:uncharacterized protein CDAR_469631 [Caerostris darwini]
MIRAVRHKCHLIVIFFCLLSVLIFIGNRLEIEIFWNDDVPLTTLFKNPKFAIKEDILNQLKMNKTPAFLLDTPGCLIPHLDPFDPSVSSIISVKKPKPCPGKPLFLVTHPNGSLGLNVSLLKKHYKLEPRKLSCTYRGIRRKPEKSGVHREENYDFGNKTKLKFGVPLKEDHVVVDCKLGKESLTQYMATPRLIPEVEKSKSSKQHIVPHLSVIVLAIDSVSKLNFLRHFKKTQTFLREKLAPFEMKGYMKVGENTFPNLMTLFTGHFVEDVWNETVRNSMYFDGAPLIWKKYGEKGYRTFFTEDMPLFGTFNYDKRGFRDPPTDYYYRPLALAIHQSKLYKNSKTGCLNSQTETDIMFNYLTDFIRVMGPRPYFSYAMSSSITHDELNRAGYADEPTARLLQNLWDMGALNDSVLFFFSDHGIRFGKIRKTYLGKFEERLPFMYVHFPAWFLRRHPNYSKNLQHNQDRLISLFDVHATLLHLLAYHRELSKNETKSLRPYGSSLLSEISPYRTCDKAGVTAPWCVCQVIQQESVNPLTILKSSSAIMDLINEKLRSLDALHKPLELDKIIEAKSAQLSGTVKRFLKIKNVVINRKIVYGEKTEDYVYYIIILSTKPGNGCYEGVVRHNDMNNSYNVLQVNQKECLTSRSSELKNRKMN